MKNLSLSNNLNISILLPNEIGEIDTKEWLQLGKNSLYNNPFYQRWNLLPAIHHLIQDSEIYIITLTNHKKLIGLFPVEILNLHNTTRYLCMWRHNHCSLTDPLLLQSVDFKKIVSKIGIDLKANWFQSSCHNPELLPRQTGVYRRLFSRAAIIDNKNISRHLNAMHGKDRREIKRTSNKLEHDFHVQHIEHQNINSGLDRYSKLEHKGWKGKNGGSILSSNDVKNYYFEMGQSSDAIHHMVFHELWADNQLIAISMRFKAQDYWFDVKTCYDEDFKQYSPGKILEIKNMLLLEYQSFKIMDSCTRSDNKLINKLWPDQLPLQSSHIFFGTFKSQWWHLIYLMKQFFERKKNYFKTRNKLTKNQS